MRSFAVLSIVLGLWAAPVAQSPQRPSRPPQADGVVRLLADLEAALQSGRLEDFQAISGPSLPAAEAARLERESRRGPAATAVVRERTRRPVGDGFEILAEVLIGRDHAGRIATWQLTVEPLEATPDRFALSRLVELASVDGLIRLALDATEQFELDDFRFEAPDLVVAMSSGTAFVARSPNGVTAVVLRGDGELTFTPPDPAEQGQLRLFAGDPDYRTDFDQAFLRLNPLEFEQRVAAGTMRPVAVDPRELRRAQDVFAAKSTETYDLDLRDLGQEHWSLEPSFGSVVVEFHSRRHDWLTYVRSPAEAEDITLFDREKRKNISVYASALRLATRGSDYSEDDDATYDVERYGLDLTFDPQRSWISGRGSLRLRIKKDRVNTLTLKLADSLQISSVTSIDHGHLLTLRVTGQNNVIVSLPDLVRRDELLVLDIVYSGRLPAQELDREALILDGQIGTRQIGEQTIFLPETRYMYSNRTAWYPQAGVSDYATAAMRLTVPSEYQVVASGTFTGSSLSEVPAEPGRDEPLFRRTVQYIADRPARYLACVISRFVPIDQIVVPVPAVSPVDPSAGGSPDDPVVTAVNVEVVSTPRMTSRNRDMPERVADILSFYATIIGEAPYPDFTLAGIDDNLPGGHSPPFLALLHQPLPTTPYVWGSDPVAFDHVYDHFFLAHEIAHQWWGQAVGWKNYHEHWLSEGLSQYFALLYAEHDVGPDLANDLLERMRRSAEALVNEGPIALGYRLGHIKEQGRTFRAIIYNKSAVVLHMLRRLIGDDAFFAGLRDLYRAKRFQKAGTSDVLAAMQAHADRPLDRFFDQWIRGAALPDIEVSPEVDNDRGVATVRVRQRRGVFDLPLRLQVDYQDGRSEFVELKLSQADETFTIPLEGEARRIQVRDDLILGRVTS